MINYNKTEFIKSAANNAGFIRDGLPQLVFAGRSNVGKSSVINRLIRRKNYARSSSTPGKTAHINYFLVDKMLYFADLPGYGYAKVSASEKERWAALMESFFREEALISGGVLIIDLRHKPTGDDIIMSDWFKQARCPMITVANKLDKVKKSEVQANLSRTAETLGLGTDDVLIPFSAATGEGREALLEAIDQLLI